MSPAAQPVKSSTPVDAGQSMVPALDSIAASAGSGITVVCGFPASGKSTAARHLAGLVDATLIDKDTFAPGLEESVMNELVGDPHDRDSDVYMRVVNPHIYSALIQQALSVGQHVPVVVDAPFIGHVRAAADRGISLSDLIRSTSAEPVPQIRTIWISAEPDRIRERMTRRGASRDAGKLSDWGTYRSDVLDSGVEDAARLAVDYFVHNR